MLADESETATTSFRPDVGNRPAASWSYRIRADARRLPVWSILLIGYALSRVLTSACLATVYWLASSQGWTFASFDGRPGLLGFMESWDGLYYRQIALDGYPTHLPVDSFGNVEKNPWAFLPLFPLVTRAAMAMTGLDFSLAGALVAAVFGAAATLALYRLLLPQVGPTSALWGSLFFCFSPLSFVLQTTYAESVFLFFMFCSLVAMASRRYLVMIPLGVAAAFSHPGALALAAALALHCIIRLYQREPFPTRERVNAVVAGLVIAAAGFAWPIIATAVTGNSSAYFDSEMSWWRDYVGEVHFVPFTPWFLMAGHYWGMIGILLVIVVLAAFAWWMSRRSTRMFGTDLLGYTVSYAAYLVAVFLPQQSLFRMLLPLSPLLGHPVLSRSPLARRLVLGACVALQPLAILLFWFVWPP